MTDQMRLYFFNLFHLSSIQQGIQAGHAAVELINKYPSDPRVDRWRLNDKTFIVKNGGDSKALNEIVELFQREENKFPWAEFREPDIEGSPITSVAILLPRMIYEGKYAANDFDKEIISLVKRTRFAT